MVGDMKKMYLGSSLLMLGLLLNIGSCNACNKRNKRNEHEGSLKLIVTGGKIEERFTAYNQNKSASFKIEVMEGEDKTDNYKIVLGILETFKGADYATDPGEDADKQVTLTAPANGATLQSLGIGDTLKKGDKKDITFTFTSNTKQSLGSSRIGVFIVGKGEKIVGGPVKLQWNHT
jgi:hypothetical protein